MQFGSAQRPGEGILRKRLVTEQRLSEITGESLSTIRRNRMLGKGCPFIKLGGSVRYDPDVIAAYLEANTRGEIAAARGEDSSA
ncbi:MAG: hypothetical protein C5B58_10925 [Acidobacteria bacterium]|nr:MAG: hypothetical protein C5B58_10925 [Acidobacteriota bacterium]